MQGGAGSTSYLDDFCIGLEGAFAVGALMRSVETAVRGDHLAQATSSSVSAYMPGT